MTPACLNDAMDFTSPQISTLTHRYPALSKTFITFALSDLVLFFNVGNTMNEAQLENTVDLLIEHYWYLRPPELKYCFNQIKLGKYGAMYNRIDGAVIFECVEKFLIERQEEIARRHVETKRLSDESAANALAVLKEKLKIDVKPKVFDEIKPREKTKEELVMDGFMRDFDKLFRDNPPEELGGIRFVPYNGKQMDISTYLQARLDEYFADKNA